MAQTILLKIQVDDAQLDELKAGLKDIGGEVEIIEGGAKKVDKSFGKIGKRSFVFQQLNRLTGGLAGNLVDVFNGLKGVSFGLKGVSAALISTGVGALVVGLGLVIAHWEDITTLINGANKELEIKQSKIEDNISSLENEIKILNIRQKIIELETGSTEEIRAKKEEVIKLQIEQNKLLIDNLKNQLLVAESKAQEFSTWQKLGRFLLGSFNGGIKAATNEEIVKIDEIKKKLEEASIEAAQAELALAQLLNPKNTGSTNSTKQKNLTPEVNRAGIVSSSEGESLEAKNQKRIFDELATTELEGREKLLENAEIANQAFLNSEQVFQAQRTQIERDAADARVRIALLEFDEKQRTLFAFGDAMLEVGNLIGEQTALGKGLSVAGALINTYASIAGQLKAFSGVPIPGFAIAQAIATGAAGFAAVKNILAVKVPGSGGTSGASTSQPAPPAFNVVESSPQNQLNNALLAQNEQPVKAFVVEGEVSNAEQLRRNKINTSSL